MLMKLDFLIPAIFLTIAGALGTTVFLLKKEDKELSIKIFLLYSLATLVAFVIIGLTGLATVERPLLFFAVLQTVFFIFGCIHAFALYRTDSWSEPESFIHEFIFTLYLTLVGAFGFLVVFMVCNKQGYSIVFASAVVFFLIPFLIMKCFDFLLMIPDEVYPKWYYPVGQGEIEIPDELLEDSSIVIVEFRMQKSNDADSELIHSRSKLPLKIELGKFFPVFLDAYNDKNPGNQIQFVDANKEPYAWNFYIEPKWWQFRTYINPETTIRENNIKENFIIVAERV
jgi:hypothetical protein